MRKTLVAVILALGVGAAPASAQMQAPEPTPTPTPTTPPVVTPAPTASPVPTAPPEPVIADGVTAGGVDLSGLTVDQARGTLRRELGRTIRRTVTLRLGGETAKLGTRKLKYEFDRRTTAERALEAEPGEAVRVKVRFKRAPVRQFVANFATRVYVAPRDAGVRIRVTHIARTKAKAGRALRVRKTKFAIVRALNDPTRSRDIEPGRKRVAADIGAKDLKRVYPTIITIDQSSFRLRLFRNLKYDRSYGVAVGQSAYPTPNGLFAIQSKQVNPTWTVPNSPWAGELQGQSVSGSDPSNPLKARWMGVSGSVGIHGTGEDYSIGSRASHGCIRMHVGDVIDLFDRVSIGTPVLIAP